MIIYISSDGSNYTSSIGSLPIGFHSFITLLNNEEEEREIKVLPDNSVCIKPKESLTISKWQSQAPAGIYLNLENVYHEQNSDFYSGIVSLSSECDEISLLSLSSFFLQYSEQKEVYANAAGFSVELWNKLSKKPIITDDIITPLWLYQFLHHKKEKKFDIPFTNSSWFGYIYHIQEQTLQTYDKSSSKTVSGIELSSFDDTMACHLYDVLNKQFHQDILPKSKTGLFPSIKALYQKQILCKHSFFPDSIIIYSAAWIDGFTLTYNGKSINHIGAKTGNIQTISISKGEYITSVKIYTNDSIIRDIWFISQSGKFYGTKGYVEADDNTFEWHEVHFSDGYALAYIEEAENKDMRYPYILTLYSCSYIEEE